VERRNFEIRKQLLEYDDVMNQQREVIYKERSKILENKDLKEEVWKMIEDTVDSMVSTYTDEKIRPEEWDVVNLAKKVRNIFSADIYGDDLKGIYNREEIREKILEAIKKAYEKREEELGSSLMRELERMILLHTIDSRWKDHLYSMDSLREGIGLRGYGQRDPLIEYKREAYQMFEELIERIKEEVAELIFKVQVSVRPSVERVQDKMQYKKVSQPALVGTGSKNADSRRSGGIYSGKSKDFKGNREFKVKVGRNDPCPCGSGKKYKYCCGKNR
jgi:preprotein translocase subunit SecA